MEVPDISLRPSELLDTLLTYSGHGRMSFPTDSPTNVYGLFLHFGDDRPRWVSLAVSQGVDSALTDAYTQTIDFLMDDYKAERGDFTRQLLALGVVAYGEGRVVQNPERERPLTADEIDDPDARMLFELSQRGGWARTRTVTLISPEGYANQTTMEWEGRPEPFTDRMEMWVSEDNPDCPTGDDMKESMGGELMRALTACFALLMLINESVTKGHEPGIAGLLATIDHHGHDAAAQQIRAFIGEFLSEREAEARRVMDETENLRRRFGDLD